MKTLLRGGPPPVQLWRRDEDNLFHHRSASRRSDSQTPGESGVPRPGPVRAARDRGPEAIPCHEFQRRPLEHWANLDPKLRTLHVCPSAAPNVARIRWGERIFQKRGSLNLLSGPQNRVSLPNKVVTSAGLSRLSVAFEIECPIVSTILSASSISSRIPVI